MNLFCSICHKEIHSENVLVAQVLAMTEGDVATLVPKAPVQIFCFGCAVDLPIELKDRFNGNVDGKLMELVNDFMNFLQHDDDSGLENIVIYLREGVNLYFGYDDVERKFTEGELIQFRLLTAEEARAIPEEACCILEDIANHVFVTLMGEAFTMYGVKAHFKQN